MVFSELHSRVVEEARIDQKMMAAVDLQHNRSVESSKGPSRDGERLEHMMFKEKLGIIMFRLKKQRFWQEITAVFFY